MQSSPSPRMREASLNVSQERVRVLVADESAMGCELLRTAFIHHPLQFSVEACAVSTSDIVRCISQGNVDVALISADLEEGRLTGLEALQELRVACPENRVVLLFDSWQDDLVIRAFRAGAKGVFCRSEPFDQLCKCIQSVHEGQIWANSHQLHLLLETLTNAGPARLPGARGVGLLTNREAQVMQLITEGMTNREISLSLGITEHTVSNYLFRIFNKLGVSTRLELALYALKQPQDDGLKTSKEARATQNIPSSAPVRKPANKGTLTRSA